MDQEPMKITGCIETIQILKKRAAFWPLHLDRLRRSVQRIGKQDLDALALEKQVERYIEAVGLSDFVLRIEYQNPHHFSYSHRSIPKPLSNALIAIFPAYHLPVFKDSWIKRNNREHYEAVSDIIADKKLDDLILLNEQGTVAESTISNIFLQNGNEWLTPSLDQGCVDGIFRRKIIEERKGSNLAVVERAIQPQELIAADKLWLCNSVRGLYPARLIDF